MGSPNAAYRELMHDYIKNSFKFDHGLVEKYNDDFLYSLSNEELEDIVKRINPGNIAYNAMMAGAIYATWENQACIDQINAACCILEDFFNLFHVTFPEKVEFNE